MSDGHYLTRNRHLRCCWPCRPRRGVPTFRPGSALGIRPRMPRIKSSALTGTAELNAMIGRVAPTILRLLADGVPRTKGMRGSLCSRVR